MCVCIYIYIPFAKLAPNWALVDTQRHTHAQGANQAIQDGLCLAQQLARLGSKYATVKGTLQTHTASNVVVILRRMSEATVFACGKHKYAAMNTTRAKTCFLCLLHLMRHVS